MKKSHRKDVIIARIIFGVLIVVVIAIIILVIAMLKNRNSDNNHPSTQSESEYVPTYIEPESEPSEVTEDTEPETESKPQVWVTRNKVRLREEPSTSSTILRQVNPSDTLLLLEEEPVDGFYRVECNGTIGYISKDFITKENPN